MLNILYLERPAFVLVLGFLLALALGLVLALVLGFPFVLVLVGCPFRKTTLSAGAGGTIRTLAIDGVVWMTIAT